MNYKEALEHSLTVRWKTTLCSGIGETCWCRIIEPEEEIKDDTGEKIYIAESGSISKEFAEHIVNLHNAFLVKNI